MNIEVKPHEMSALPLVICSVCACAPRLTEPPVPPTLRQMEHTQSWYGTGVLDWTVKATAPQWQLPLSSTGMTDDHKGVNETKSPNLQIPDVTATARETITQKRIMRSRIRFSKLVTILVTMHLLQMQPA